MKKLVALAALGTTLASAIPAQAAGLDIGIRPETWPWSTATTRAIGAATVESSARRSASDSTAPATCGSTISTVMATSTRARVVNRRGVIFALTLDAYDGGIRRVDIVGREHFYRG